MQTMNRDAFSLINPLVSVDGASATAVNLRDVLALCTSTSVPSAELDQLIFTQSPRAFGALSIALRRVVDSLPGGSSVNEGTSLLLCSAANAADFEAGWV